MPTGPLIMKEVATCRLPCSAEPKHFTTGRQLDMWFRLHKKKCSMCNNIKQRITHNFIDTTDPKGAEKITRLNQNTAVKDIWEIMDTHIH
jgi:hypothetical protein